MIRYISLLLFIGLAWGQEYDPETGEVVKKQYEPETGELIKDQNYPDSLVSPSHPIISVAFPQLSIKNKRIHNHEIDEYYSDDEFINRLNSDPNFVNDENFISYKKYVNRLKSKGSKCIYCYSFVNIAVTFYLINNPDDSPDEDNPPGLQNIAFGILLPFSYHTYNSDKKRKTLYNVIQRHNNIYSKQYYSDSLVSLSHPKVNSDLKNISISHLTKEQKKKYNQNRITMLVKNPIDWSIYRGQEELYLSEFFIFTGYPEKAEIVKHNAQLKTKNMWRGCGWYSLCALIGLAPPLGGGSATDDTIEMGIVGGLVGIAYFFYDYNEKKLEGPSLNDAKIIAEKYNNDLIQRIFNEND